MILSDDVPAARGTGSLRDFKDSICYLNSVMIVWPHIISVAGPFFQEAIASRDHQ